VIKEGKLNFTGKPFAPDSIFINNLDKNINDDEERMQENTYEVSTLPY